MMALLLRRHFPTLCLILMVLACLVGLLAAHGFGQGLTQGFWSFTKSRALHETLVTGWIFGSSIGLILQILERKATDLLPALIRAAFALLGLAIVLSLLTGTFGGREYWRFHPGFAPLIALIWVAFGIFLLQRTRAAARPLPIHLWMWWTGWVGFLITYSEFHLYLIPSFEMSFPHQVLTQWKAMGSLVGSWNMLVYGIQFWVASRLSEQEKGLDARAFAFYFLSLANLMFNWGHHVYPVPIPQGIKHLAYLVSMSELLFFIKLVHDWRGRIPKIRRLMCTEYAFLLAAEIWGYLNLALALAMSVPYLNQFTHGTHVTVAHAMGSTIGINSMILLGCWIWVLKPNLSFSNIRLPFWILQVGTLVLFASLVGMGLHPAREMGWTPAWLLFFFAGLAILLGVAGLVWRVLTAPVNSQEPSPP